MSFDERVLAIAVEHFLWAREAGQSHGEILRSIGLPASHATERAVIDGLRRTWLAMQMGWRHTRCGAHPGRHRHSTMAAE